MKNIWLPKCISPTYITMIKYYSWSFHLILVIMEQWRYNMQQTHILNKMVIHQKPDLLFCHYDYVIKSAIGSQIISPTIVNSTTYSSTDERKRQTSASLAFVRGIHRWPENSPHKGPVTRKMFPFDDVIMLTPFQNPCQLTRFSNIVSDWLAN